MPAQYRPGCPRSVRLPPTTAPDRDRYDVDSVTVCDSPLKDYGEFSWYDPPFESMPDGFGLVICYGPPGDTKGGRVGLVPIMRARLQPGCIVLLDVANREQEIAIAKRWEDDLDVTVKSVGSVKPYMKLTVGGNPPAGELFIIRGTTPVDESAFSCLIKPSRWPRSLSEPESLS